MKKNAWKLIILLLILFNISIALAVAQTNDTINWLSYENETSKSSEIIKPFFLFFFNSNSLPETEFFKDTSIIQLINNKYIPIKINLEEPEGIDFFNKTSKASFSSCPQQGTIIIIQNSGRQFLESRLYCEGSISNIKDFSDFLNKYAYTLQSVNLGNITIMKYNSYINESKNKYNIVVNAKIWNSKVKEISAQSDGQSSIILDDGTGILRVFLADGLGKLNIEDSINVEIINDGRLSIPKILTVENSKKSGFTQIFGFIFLFLILYAFNKKKIKH